MSGILFHIAEGFSAIRTVVAPFIASAISDILSVF